MEGAPLRPVPARPAGPVDPEDAFRHVQDALPELDEHATRALALVAIAGRPRDRLAAEVGLADDDLLEVLARGRKALRRSLYPLPGSGWCERAERMISDRLDGELAPPGPARLDAHLRNCARCVEHELRLAQATDSLVSAFIERHPQPEPEPEPEPEVPQPPAAPLRVVAPEERAPRPKPEARPKPAPKKDRPAAPRRTTPAALAWYGLFALAVLLAIATVAIAVIGILGGHL